MKKKIIAYVGLSFFALMFGFLIWGLVNIITQFYGRPVLTFLSVITPNVIALSYIGFNLVVFILKVKHLHKQPRKVKDPTPPPPTQPLP